MRISGFASGFDIDQIVNNLMAAHRKPLDRIVQQKQKVEWQREEYRKINSMMLDFRNNKLTQFRSSSQINAKSAVVTGDTATISARATQVAANGTMTISVSQLAKSANMVSSASVKPGEAVKVDDTLKQVFGDVDFGNQVKINDAIIEFDMDVDTVNSLIQKINANADARVNAFFDHDSGMISLTSTVTGKEEKITIENVGTGSQNIMIDGFKLSAEADNGQNAKLNVNGIAIERSSNKFTINGIELTLNGVSAAGQESTINTGSDVDKIFDTVASFVNEYNKLLDAVNTKLGEERFRSFHPLTPEQKKEMSEEEVKLWEEKARSGMLARDSILSNLVNELRLSIISDVGTGADKINLTSLGITTGIWSERGKLVIDEDKLRAAIEADPDQVMNVFAKPGDEKGASADKGIFHRMSDILMDAMTEVSNKAGTSTFNMSDNYEFSKSSSMGEEIRQLDIRMENLNRRLALLETRYFKQFTAMETSISRFNNQASMFSNM